jgi:hypothetical protein
MAMDQSYPWQVHASIEALASGEDFNRCQFFTPMSIAFRPFVPRDFYTDRKLWRGTQSGADFVCRRGAQVAADHRVRCGAFPAR